MAVGRRGKRTVALQTQLQFGPKETALAGLIQQAGTAKRQDIRSTRAAAKGSIKAAKAARSEIARNYAAADADLARTAADVQKVAGSTSDVAGELARASARNTLDEQLDRNENTARIRETREGRRGDVRAIRQQFRGDLKDIADQLVALQGEKGTYAASALQAISDQNRKDRRAAREARKERRGEIRKTTIQEAGDTERNEADIRSAEKIAADKLAAADKATPGTTSKGGVKPATRSELKTFRSQVSKAISYGKLAKQAKPKPLTYAQALEQLSRVQPSRTTADGTFYPATEAIDDPIALRAALQQVYYGYVKPELAKKIRRQYGIKPYQTPGLRKRGNAYSGRPHDSQQR